ncbi:MAG: hypothetical protein HQM16_10565 [Deltaproteobacteria bacterium]|nr:hypothetical protein [Deltaproteobacteria bacterium]
MTTKIFLLMIILLLVVSPQGLLAMGPAAHAPCASDIQKFCANIKSGLEITTCLKKARLKLTPECKTHIDTQENADKNEPDCDKNKKQKDVPDETCLPDELVFEEIKAAE